MIDEFRKFLVQTNALALAIGVIIGAAVGKVVGSLASDILMPIIGIALPGGGWREQKIVLSTNPDGTVANAITFGAFIGALVDFIIIALVVFMVAKALLKPAPPAATKECPACLEIVPKGATRCRACTSPL